MLEYIIYVGVAYDNKTWNIVKVDHIWADTLNFAVQRAISKISADKNIIHCWWSYDYEIYSYIKEY